MTMSPRVKIQKLDTIELNMGKVAATETFLLKTTVGRWSITLLNTGYFPMKYCKQVFYFISITWETYL